VAGLIGVVSLDLLHLDHKSPEVVTLRYRNILAEYTMPVLNDYLDVVEAANILGVHWETVKRLCREHKLPASKVHNKWLIHKDVLHRFAEIYDNGRRSRSKNQVD